MPDNPPTAVPAVKPRNPVEKAIVRGFIGCMLVVVAIEAYFWLQCRSAMAPLLERIQAAENGIDLPPLVEADIKAAVGSKPPVQSVALEPGTNGYGATRVDVYSWFTINPLKKREMYVYYGVPLPTDRDGPEVVAVQTDGEIPTKVTPRPMTAKEEAEWAKAKEIMEGSPGGPPGIDQVGPAAPAESSTAQ
jgi:hypothetical protein